MKYGKAQVEFGVLFTSTVDGKKWPPLRSGCNIPVKAARLGTLPLPTAEIYEVRNCRDMQWRSIR